MPTYEHAENLFLESVIVTCGGFFLAVLVVLLCAGKKKPDKQSEQQDEEVRKVKEELQNPDDVIVPEVVIDIDDVTLQKSITLNNDSETEDVAGGVSGNIKGSAGTGNVAGACDKSEEVIEMYDPQMTRSQTLQQQQQQQKEDVDDAIVDPYEKIDKSQIHPKLNDVKTSGETSGSGNSDSGGGGGIYTRVKDVPKAEEIAYAVVDIKDSQNKYEVVDGDLVRKVVSQNQDGDVAAVEETVGIEIENEAISSEVIDDTQNPHEISREDSVSSGLYASVSKRTTESVDSVQMKPPEQCNDQAVVVNEDEYAVVSKPRKDSSVLTETNEKQQEDSGNSGLYAAVVHETGTKTPPVPPPLPPIHPLNATKFSSIDQGDHSDNDTTYEHIGNASPVDSLERDNTYDCISDSFKVNIKKNKRKNSKELIDSPTNNKKHMKQDQSKLKHNKSMKESQGPTSPKPSSGLFRGNLFKLSKKYRKSVENLQVDHIAIDENITNNEEEEYEKLQAKSNPQTNMDKVRSLPISTRKSPPVSDDKRFSVPPPLPSFDKLKLLSEHNQKMNRAASIDNCSSPETSPKSPRSPVLRTSSTHHIKISADSTTTTTAATTTTTTKLSETLLDEEDDKYSTIKTPIKITETVETLQKTDHSEVEYSVVDRSLKESVLNGKINHDSAEILHEPGHPEVEYSVVDRSLKEPIVNGKTKTETAETLHDPVHSDLLDSLSGADDKKKIMLDSDSKNLTEKTILTNENVDLTCGSVTDDIPDYAIVDLTKKYIERQSQVFLDKSDYTKAAVKTSTISAERPKDTKSNIDGDYETLEFVSPKIQKKSSKRKSNDSDYMYLSD